MIKGLVLRLFSTLGALIGIGGCSTSPAAYEPAVSDSSKLSEIIQDEITRNGIPSAAVSIARGEGPALTAASGATRQGGPRVNASSLYHIGSTTKSMTALIAAHLVAEGLHRYDTSM